MQHKKELKNRTYIWDEEAKHFFVCSNDSATEISLSKSEAGALQRFIFSMFQFHSHKKKQRKTAEVKAQEVQEELFEE